MLARLRLETDGANAVEFALVFPILLVLIFGTIYFGFAFNTKLTLTQAAREGARFGATLPFDREFENDLPEKAQWFDPVAAKVAESAFGDGGLGNQDRRVCVAYIAPNGVARIGYLYPDGTAVSDCGVPGNGGPNGARVEVTAAREVPIELIFFPLTADVESAGIARYEVRFIAPATS